MNRLVLPVFVAATITFVTLFVISMTVWKPAAVPRLVRTFTTSTTAETLSSPTQTIDFTIENPEQNSLQNFYMASWDGDTIGNGISCQNLKNIEPSTNNGYRTCQFVSNNATSISLRVQFPIPVTSFEWAMND